MTHATGTTKAVAIDGPAGAGKSTVARGVAARLGFTYIDTGAMYRAVALKALRSGLRLDDEKAMADLARTTSIDFDPTGTKIIMDGKDVSAEIRSPEVTDNVKYAARVPEVRSHMANAQRAMSGSRPVVMEGRDIGLVVLPAARWKFFLTASAQTRAERRFAEMTARGFSADLQAILDSIIARDEADNQVGPLKETRELALAGKGVHYLDTTGMPPGEVIESIARIVETG